MARPDGRTPFDHTSVLATIRNCLDLDGPLTERDAHAPDVGCALSLKRPRKDKPTVTPLPYRTKKDDVRSMGAADLLVGAMAMHLVRVHGRENVRLLTADRRMDAIFDNACPKLNRATAEKLGLIKKAKDLGFSEWSPEIYPQVLDLQRCKDADLARFFGEWPLPTRKKRGVEGKA